MLHSLGPLYWNWRHSSLLWNVISWKLRWYQNNNSVACHEAIRWFLIYFLIIRSFVVFRVFWPDLELFNQKFCHSNFAAASLNCFSALVHSFVTVKTCIVLGKCEGASVWRRRQIAEETRRRLLALMPAQDLVQILARNKNEMVAWALILQFPDKFKHFQDIRHLGCKQTFMQVFTRLALGLTKKTVVQGNCRHQLMEKKIGLKQVASSLFKALTFGWLPPFVGKGNRRKLVKAEQNNGTSKVTSLPRQMPRTTATQDVLPWDLSNAN